MIGDASTLAVDVEALVSVASGCNAFEMTQQARFELELGQPVDAPYDHRGPADHAVRDPAVAVLVMPLGHTLRAAQQALVAHVDAIAARVAGSPTCTPWSSNQPRFVSIAMT